MRARRLEQPFGVACCGVDHEDHELCFHLISEVVVCLRHAIEALAQARQTSPHPERDTGSPSARHKLIDAAVEEHLACFLELCHPGRCREAPPSVRDAGCEDLVQEDAQFGEHIEPRRGRRCILEGSRRRSTRAPVAAETRDAMVARVQSSTVAIKCPEGVGRARERGASIGASRAQ